MLGISKIDLDYILARSNQLNPRDPSAFPALTAYAQTQGLNLPKQLDCLTAVRQGRMTRAYDGEPPQHGLPQLLSREIPAVEHNGRIRVDGPEQSYDFPNTPLYRQLAVSPITPEKVEEIFMRDPEAKQMGRKDGVLMVNPPDAIELDEILVSSGMDLD